MMAMQIARERVFGNFRKRGLKPKRPKTKKRPGMSQDHLACIRKCPCIRCLKVPAGEAHHLKQYTGERGMGLRSTDKWAVPLCGPLGCHEDVERAGSGREAEWFKAFGIDALALADALWHASGDVPRMTKIVLTQRGRL